MTKILSFLLLVFIPILGVTQEHDHSAHESHSVTDGQSATSSADSPENEIDFWTCSMHPQIKLPGAGKCPICSMDLIPVYKDEGGGDDSGDVVTLKLSRNAESLAEVSTSLVTRQPVLKEVRMVGLLDYDETRLTHITAWVPGRIDRMFVDYTGVSVKNGDHMVEMYSPELISAQEELIQAAKSLKKLQSSGSSLVRKSTEQALTSSREKLVLLGLTEQQVKDIERRGKASDQVTIYAPAAGVVVERNATEGMYVKTGTRVYSIADLSNLWLHLDAYESDLPWIRYGQKVEFTTQAFPGKVFRGTISFIAPVLNPMTRTTKVRVSVVNTDGALKPGLFVNGIVKASVYGEGRVVDTSLKGKYIGPMHPEVVKDEPGACPVCGMDLVKAEDLGYITDADDAVVPIVIPVSAPLLTGKRAVVYVKDPDSSRYELREVVLGPRSGDFYIVESGLREGELVVTNGAFKIDADLQIKGKKSMMNPDAIKQTGGHQHGDSGGMKGEPSGGEMEDHSKHSSAKELKPLPEKLAPIVDAYLNLSEALASDDLSGSQGAFLKVEETLKQAGKHKLHALILGDLNKLEDFESIRGAFGKFSKGFLEELSIYHLPKKLDAFKAHCPMAGDGKGAFWIQRGKEVRNPFYGSSMLSCGSIEGAL